MVSKGGGRGRYCARMEVGVKGGDEWRMQLEGRLFVLVRWKWQGTNDAFEEREKGG